jgi:hypothetical protein
LGSRVKRIAALLRTRLARLTGRRWRGRTRRLRRRLGPRGAAALLLEAELDVLLEPLQLRFQLAIAKLQLLDRAVQLADLALQPVDPHQKIGGRDLRHLHTLGRSLARRRPERIAALTKQREAGAVGGGLGRTG